MDTASGVPFYRQIILQIEQAILSHRMEPGDRLPTIRALAIQLKINPNTIAKAYSELEIRGIVVTQVGSGTFISEKRIVIEEAERAKKIEESIVRFIREMEALGLTQDEAQTRIRDYKGD
ncbi:GntR family transcriptional regulator [Treponema sp.]